MKTKSRKIFELFKHTLWLESPEAFGTWMWVFDYPCHMHLSESLWKLFWEVVREYKHDRHLVG